MKPIQKTITYPLLFSSCLFPSAAFENGFHAIEFRALRTLLSIQPTLYIHSLNQRLGDLKEYRYTEGVWARTSYAQQSPNPNSNLVEFNHQYFTLQGGYDHAFKLASGQNFLGISLEYGHSWLNSEFFEGEGHRVGLLAYSTLLTHQRFYIDIFFKYLYSTDHISLKQSLLGTQKINRHLIHANIELGEKFIFGHLFFLQPLAQVGVGFTPQNSFLFHDQMGWDLKLSSQNTFPLFAQIGAYSGIELKSNVKGDVRFGAFFQYDHDLKSNLTLSDSFLTTTYDDLRNNYLVLKFATNLHLHKQLRLYLSAQTSFFGKINTDYGLNLGVRYLFGKDYTPRRKPSNTSRDLDRVKQNMLYESEQSRLRSQNRLLSAEELAKQQAIQNNRNQTQVQINAQEDRRIKYLRDSANWIDIQQNEQNYQNRNFSEIQNRDQNVIRSNNQKELERKYGK